MSTELVTDTADKKKKHFLNRPRKAKAAKSERVKKEGGTTTWANLATVAAAILALVAIIVSSVISNNQTALSVSPVPQVVTSPIHIAYELEKGEPAAFINASWYVTIKNVGMGPAINLYVEFDEPRLNLFMNELNSNDKGVVFDFGSQSSRSENGFLTESLTGTQQQITFDPVQLGVGDEITLDLSELAKIYALAIRESLAGPETIKLNLTYYSVVNRRASTEVIIRLSDLDKDHYETSVDGAITLSYGLILEETIDVR